MELEEKIAAMRTALDEDEGEFWKARRSTLPLFRENVHPAIRAKFWKEFRDLSDRARNRK